MCNVLPSKHYFSTIKRLARGAESSRFVSIDIETLVRGKDLFLTGEPLIAITVSNDFVEPHTRIFMAVAETKSQEERILRELDTYLAKIDPVCIMGYNHISYDIPLIQMKLRNLAFHERLWNIGNYFGSSILVDMMYVIASDLYRKTGTYRIRKLKDVVSAKEYLGLPLNRKKDLVQMNGKSVGEAIEFLWKNETEKFLQYCKGDTEDLLHIFRQIFMQE